MIYSLGGSEEDQTSEKISLPPAFAGYLGEYDTKAGWSNNFLLEGGGENLSGGAAFNTRHFEPLAFVPLAKYAGLVLGTTGVGGYVGTPKAGGGLYANISSILNCEQQ